MNTEIPHPRTVFECFGGATVDEAFVDAIDRGRLHHAWLLVGPRGIGKATFAYRAARRLLGAEIDPELGILASRPEDPVCRQIVAQAHPDLLVLQRETGDAKARKSIPVDEARMLPDFFSKSPATAPYRVAIIDAADDLNPNAANAVLKTLEEPPARGVLFLVSHAPGALLPTLRSRCRRLRFPAAPEGEASFWVSRMAGVDQTDAQRLLSMAGGAPGRAWCLAVQGALQVDDEARNLLSQLPTPDSSFVSALEEGLRNPSEMEKFHLFFNRLTANIHSDMLERVQAGQGTSLDAWSEVWEYLVRLPTTVEAVNLDRVDAFMSAVGRLRKIADSPC